MLTRRKLLKNSLLVGASMASLGTRNILAVEKAHDELVPSDYEDITEYNNYYEFSTDKYKPKDLAQQLTIKPWQVEISGGFDKTGIFDLDDVLKSLHQEERIYRFRCVEGWARIVPWQGVLLADLLNKFGVQSSMDYIAFESLWRPEEMPGTRYPLLDWPYREGLRMDEAMHPLTMLATGLYGKPLPKQNGAPLRLVVPWKYGFKSIKAITKIQAQKQLPYASWAKQNPREYGFYANVNPHVDHPRWSQASERIIGGGLFAGRQPTLPFNGYQEVASLYQGMDLRKYY